MTTHIITNTDIIEKLTNDIRINKMILHLNSKKKIAKYESDYTLFELTIPIDYDKAVKVLN